MEIDTSTELYYEPRKEVLDILGGAEWVPEMSEFESAFLCGLLRRYRPRKIVEIGVAAGSTTAIMLHCANSLGLEYTMYSIDASERFYRDEDKISGYLATEYLSKSTFEKGNVSHQFLLGKTLPHIVDQLGEGIDFVILDTMHVLPGEILDFLAILPRLTSSAVICLHDISLNQLTESNNIATNVLYSNATAKKIMSFLPQANRYGANYPNIGAFQINDDTKKYIENIFLALLLNWAYIPSESDLKAYLNLYKTIYPDVLIRLFENAVIYNKPHEKYIFPFEQIAPNSRIVLYGAGNVGQSYYRQIQVAGNIHIVQWVDKNFRNIQSKENSYVISDPSSISPDVCDYVVIALWSEDVARGIEKELEAMGFLQEAIVWVQHT